MELSVGSGRRRVVVGLLRAGDVDGDIPVLLGLKTPYTGRAITPASGLFLSTEAFERLLAEHPAIARRWLSSVAARLAHSNTRLLDLLGRSLEEQAARLLLDEADSAPDSRPEVLLPQSTLAAMLGVQRPSLNKLLKDFERRGLISVGYRQLRILDRRGLERVANR